MKLKTFVAWLGAALLLLVLVLGAFVKVSVPGPNASTFPTVNCGTGWTDPPIGQAPRDASFDQAISGTNGGPRHDYEAECSAAKSSRQTVIWALLGVGAALLVGGIFVGRESTPKRRRRNLTIQEMRDEINHDLST